MGGGISILKKRLKLVGTLTKRLYVSMSNSSLVDLFNDVIAEAPPKKFNNLVAKYLIHSYLYYILDDSIIPDQEYDMLCKELLENIDTITHPHKYLIDVEALKAGSGFQIGRKDYPLIVQETAKMMLCEHKGVQYVPGR